MENLGDILRKNGTNKEVFALVKFKNAVGANTVAELVEEVEKNFKAIKEIIEEYEVVELDYDADYDLYNAVTATQEIFKGIIANVATEEYIKYEEEEIIKSAKSNAKLKVIRIKNKFNQGGRL